MKTHTGIKEFKCETCGKEFMIERNLVSIKLNFLSASLHSYLFPPSPPLLTLHEISLYLTLVTQNILCTYFWAPDPIKILISNSFCRCYITNFIVEKKISFAQFAIEHITRKVVCKPIIDKCIWRQIQTIRLCASIVHSSALPDMNCWSTGNFT